jgi:hypothetical protein
MTSNSKQDANKKTTRLMMVLAFVLLSVGTSFGQTETQNESTVNNNIVNTTTEINTIKEEAASTTTNMNFVLWFMGSKQDPNAKALPEGVNTKKQFMTSGTAPNRLLIKAFLKKAINFESATV